MRSIFLSRRMYLSTVGLWGYLRAIACTVLKTTAYFTIKRHDCRYPFQVRMPSSDIPTYRQVFFDHDYDCMASGQPKIIVDAGANIGIAAIYFANKYPDAKIIAIEPEDSNFELLKNNTEPYPGIIPVQAALWHVNEDINVIDAGYGKWGFMTEMKNSQEKLPGSICQAVAGMTVDRIMRDYALEKIDILKIDIEGAEREVFSSTSAWLDKVDAIIIELHDRMKAGCSRSFYRGTSGFDNEWRRGENVYVSRRGSLKSGTA